MRRLLPWIVVFLSLIASVPASARRDTAFSDLTVIVHLTDMLSVTDAGVITLDNSDVDPAAGDRIGPDSDSSALLNYTHNFAALMKITAQVTSNPTNHDISLSVQTAGMPAAKSLVSQGQAMGAQEIFTNIPAGALSDQAIAYSAECTASGTPLASPTDFLFIITFTSIAQ